MKPGEMAPRNETSPNARALCLLTEDWEVNEETWSAMIDAFHYGRMVELVRREDETVVETAKRIAGVTP